MHNLASVKKAAPVALAVLLVLSSIGVAFGASAAAGGTTTTSTTVQRTSTGTYSYTTTSISYSTSTYTTTSISNGQTVTATTSTVIPVTSTISTYSTTSTYSTVLTQTYTTAVSTQNTNASAVIPIAGTALTTPIISYSATYDNQVGSFSYIFKPYSYNAWVKVDGAVSLSSSADANPLTIAMSYTNIYGQQVTQIICTAYPSSFDCSGQIAPEIKGGTSVQIETLGAYASLYSISYDFEMISHA